MSKKKIKEAVGEKAKKKKDLPEQKRHSYQRKPVTEHTPLTIMEEKFIKLYLQTGNGKQSVIQAGYHFKGDSAKSYATRLLSKVNVKYQLTKKREEMNKKGIADAEEVMDYFSRVMRGEIKDQFGLDAPLGERTRAAMELAKRTVDIDNRKAGQPDNVVKLEFDWGLEDDSDSNNDKNTN
jgi:phage terminase small subunit